MKYITYQRPTGSIIRFIVFDKLTQHNEVADALGLHDRRNVMGAGFIEFHNGKAHCHGESVSLGIKSREREDEAIIDMINSL